MNGSDFHRASWRLGLQTAALLLTCVVLVGLTVFVVADRAAARQGEQAVRAASAHVDKPEEAPRGIQIVIERSGVRRTSANLPVGFPIEPDFSATRSDGRVRERTVAMYGDHFLVRTERVGSRVNQAIYDEEEYEAERRRLLAALFFAGGLGVVLSAAAGVVLARRGMRPMAESLAMQQRFVADASHELRTPLTLLSTRVQLLARQLRRGGVPVEGEIEGILGDTRRLGDILEELLMAADTRATTEDTVVDVAIVVAEAVDAATASALERGLTLSATGEATALVRGSETALRRAILALVDNALDHAASAVVANLAVTRGSCRVEVSDDGHGIDADVLPRIFQRFASSRSTHSERRHYGLGLALVADVATAHGGRVQAGPGPHGTGAMLSLTLPLAHGSDL